MLREKKAIVTRYEKNLITTVSFREQEQRS